MTDREKLIELMSYFGDCQTTESREIVPYTRIVEIVDHLIANGVTVQEWIPVTEGLPEAEKEVRVLCKASFGSKYRYQCQAFYEPKGMLREASDYVWDYECCSEYSEEDDDYFVNPGWYERIHNWDDYSAVGIADEVTHWMPLPEPPKEDKK